jgi:molybdopterin synthase sulfur carrier subunit
MTGDDDAPERAARDASDGGESDDDDGAARPPAEEGWVRETVAYRGISRRLAAHYLGNLGGELVDTDDPAEATRVEGDEWRVALSAETVTAAAAITLTEVTAEFAGAPEALDELLPQYRQKAMRAGG